MNKHELIVAIQSQQELKQVAVQSYEKLMSFRETELQEQLINLSIPACLIDFDIASKLIKEIRNKGFVFYNPITKDINPDTGYLVNFYNTEYRIPRVWNTMDLKHVINVWLVERGLNTTKMWNEYSGHILLREEDNVLVITFTQLIPAKDKAVSVAKLRFQPTVWDCAESENITTGLTA